MYAINLVDVILLLLRNHPSYHIMGPRVIILKLVHSFSDILYLKELFHYIQRNYAGLESVPTLFINKVGLVSFAVLINLMKTVETLS